MRRWITLLLMLQAARMPLSAELPDPSVPPGDTSALEPPVSREHQEALQQMARFTLALEQIRRLHASKGEEIRYEVLVDHAIEGMMSGLDRFSSFLDSDDARSMREESQGAFGGIGVVIQSLQQWITVVSPIEDSPGWEAGLLAHDRIVAIDGESTRGMTVEGASARLRGRPGTEVHLRVSRSGREAPLDLTLVRAVIETRPVQRLRMLNPDTGYIRVNSFARNTAPLLRQELTALSKRKARRLVLDLRGNPGGLLDAAVEVASLFLPRGTLVVYTLGREEADRTDHVTKNRPHRFAPELVVLVNEGTASAAEIVSGALQDHRRARIVGRRSFGKASVQSILPLPDGSALRLTTGYYYTPSHRAIHEKGIVPDVEVDLSALIWREVANAPAENWDWSPDSQIRKAVELLAPPAAAPPSTETP